MDTLSQLPDQARILIVGAGPTGLTLAADLKRRGVETVIIDKLSAGENTSRAAVVHAHTLEVLEPLGVTPRLIENGIKVPIFRIRERDRILLTLNFDEIPSPYTYALMCPQNRTEAILLDRLHELGGNVFRPAEITQADIRHDGAEVKIEAAGTSHTMRTNWLIGCDGAKSLVREQAGIPFEGGAYEASFVLADVHMDWPFERDEVNLFFSPEGLVVVAPLPDNHFRIVATMDNPPANPGRNDVQMLLDARGPQAKPAVVQDCIWTSRFHVHHRVAESPRKGRVLLCGDAAHVHSPAGGQGMNTGIQDATTLAAVLAEVVNGAPDSRLDDWADRRHKVAERVVDVTDRMTRAGLLRSPTARKMRNALLAFAGHFPWLTDAAAKQIAELNQE